MSPGCRTSEARIPLPARVVQLAAAAALVAEADGHAQAIALVRGDRGKRFDPALTEAFVDLAEREGVFAELDSTTLWDEVLRLEDELHIGPEGHETIPLSDAWLADVLRCAETAFLASLSPDGQPDASHRGGLSGFLAIDAAHGSLSWPEYIGDGMLKSAGIVRATGTVTLPVIDLGTGDAAEISGDAIYQTVRLRKLPRDDGGLERNTEPFPVQGRMAMTVKRVERLRRVVVPRERLAKALKITSRSPIEVQAPQ